MEIITLPVISTGHLTKEVAARLTRQRHENPWVTCTEWQSGLLISLQGIEDKIQAGHEIPQCIQDIAAWLKQKTLPCSSSSAKWASTWICLDPDADPTEDLTSYSW